MSPDGRPDAEEDEVSLHAGKDRVLGSNHLSRRSPGKKSDLGGSSSTECISTTLFPGDGNYYDWLTRYSERDPALGKFDRKVCVE